jgi:hypothetical protein
LNDFAGTKAHAESKDAADTLEKFIARCHSMGQAGRACLKFQPTLAANLGNTVDQLLGSMNLGVGQNGIGAGGGYMSRRTSLANVGLYGTIPLKSQESRGGGGKADHGATADGRGDKPGDTDPSAVGANDKTKIAGASDAAVPAQYRARVGEYFQRVADELDEK